MTAEGLASTTLSTRSADNGRRGSAWRRRHRSVEVEPRALRAGARKRALERVAGVLGERQQHARAALELAVADERGREPGCRAAAADEVDAAERGLRRLGRRRADDGDAACARAARARAPRTLRRRGAT